MFEHVTGSVQSRIEPPPAATHASATLKSRRKAYLRHLGQARAPLRQTARRVPRAVDQVGEMVLQRRIVGGLVYVLQDVEDDAGVAVRVEEDFLVVGDFADSAGGLLDVGGLGGGRMNHLTSLYWVGRSMVMAPP